MQTNIQITSSKQEEHGAKTYSFYSNNDKIQIKQHVKQATVAVENDQIDHTCRRQNQAKL